MANDDMRDALKKALADSEKVDLDKAEKSLDKAEKHAEAAKKLEAKSEDPDT